MNRNNVSLDHSRSSIDDDHDEEILARELIKFQILHDRWIEILYTIEMCSLALGLFGNTIALSTLMRSRQMQTPSFVYHKTLVLAYLIYCVNFLIVKCVNATLTVPGARQQLTYSNQVAAYYSVVLNRVISSACGYVALYTSLAISVDRFLALVLLKHYSTFNRHVVAYLWVAFCLVLSFCVHSWSPWLENGIETVQVPGYCSGQNHTVTAGTYCRNHTVTAGAYSRNHTVTAYRQTNSFIWRRRLKPYLVAKDWYNLTIRFVYAILLIILTWIVICMYAKRMKKRQTLRSVSKRQTRRERSLFYLMVAVVSLAYIQVIPRESKRVLELIYPTEYIGSNFADRTLPVERRKMYMLFGLYAYTFTTPILNLCTIVERSLLFYFYFALNHSFRKETLVLLHLRKFWRLVSKKFGYDKGIESRRSKRKRSTRRKNRNKESVLAVELAISHRRSRYGRRSSSETSTRRLRYGSESESSCATIVSYGQQTNRTRYAWSAASSSSKRGSSFSCISEISNVI